MTVIESPVLIVGGGPVVRAQLEEGIFVLRLQLRRQIREIGGGSIEDDVRLRDDAEILVFHGCAISIL